MNAEDKITKITPPGLIASFSAGFNAVANHIQLILFPVALDLLLWFGPHLRVKQLIEPYLASLGTRLSQTATPDMSNMFSLGQEAYNTALAHFNLVSLLRTFPVGISSLFASFGPLETPLGTAPIYEITSLANTFGLWLIFSILGILLGSFYFNEVARQSMPEHTPFSLGAVNQSAVQILLMTILAIILLFLLALPVIVIISIVALFSAALAQIAFFIISMFLIWLLLPLFFTPHGIFVYHQNTLKAMWTSLRLVRQFLPTTGMFILFSLLISQGLNLVWLIPPENSWMFLIGIAGHAFISTGLLAASFIYYRNGIHWMQELLKQLNTSRAES